MVYYRTLQDELGLILSQQIQNHVRSSLGYDQEPRKKSEPELKISPRLDRDCLMRCTSIWAVRYAVRGMRHTYTALYFYGASK
jgi:hypothetical protein